MNIQTMLSMRHVAPFREEAQNELQILSDTSDILERWLADKGRRKSFAAVSVHLSQIMACLAPRGSLGFILMMHFRGGTQYNGC